jgi:hypothetical protein
MKNFLLSAALTLALAAGGATILTVQLVHAAAHTLAFGVGTLAGVTLHQP